MTITVACRPRPVFRGFSYPWMTRFHVDVTFSESGANDVVRVYPLREALRFTLRAPDGTDPVALDALDEITESRIGEDEFRTSWEIDPDWGSGFTIVAALPSSISLEPGRYEVSCRLDPEAVRSLSGARVQVEYAAPKVLEVKSSRTREERIREILAKAAYLREVAGRSEEKAAYEAALREFGDVGWALLWLGWMDIEDGDCRGAVVKWERAASSYRRAGAAVGSELGTPTRGGYPLAVWAACYELLDQRLRAQQLLEEHLPDEAARERVSADVARALAAMRGGEWEDLARGLVLAPVAVR